MSESIFPEIHILPRIQRVIEAAKWLGRLGTVTDPIVSNHIRREPVEQ